MKKTLFLALTPLLFSSCTKDYYEGDERIIVEGMVTYNNKPLQNAEVRIYPLYNVSPTTDIVSEITTNNSYDYIDDGYTIVKTKTDATGKINTSLPKNINTNVYGIKISNGYNSKYYGYISNYNVRNHYVNLGTLNY